MNCYCGNNNSYNNCCEIYHKNGGITKTAQQLMRSRYSAFVLANGDYLMQSHHSSTRPTKEKKVIIEWTKLGILETSKGNENDADGTVTFNAYFYEHGTIKVIHEKSAFIKENNKWTYLGLSR